VEKTYIIVNPVAAQGGCLKEFKKVKGILETLKEPAKVFFTEYPKHAMELARSAVKEGAERIVSFGGDGTHNEVLNGILLAAEELFKKTAFEFKESEKEALPTLGIVSVGSGNDFGKTLRIPKDTITSLKVALFNKPHFTDAGYFEFEDYDRNNAKRFFLNILSGGFSGVVTDRANKSKKSIFKGLSYLIALISTLINLTIPDGVLKQQKKEDLNGKFFEFDVANGEYFGGGMHVSPKAIINDGFLNVSVFKDYTSIEILFKLKKLFDGTILTEKKLYHDFTKEVFIKTNPKSLVEVDGEVVGYTPVLAKVLENTVKIAMP